MRGGRTDVTFLALLGAVIVLGLVMLTSASGPVAYANFDDSFWYLKHQLLYGLLPGCVAFAALSRIDYRTWRAYAMHLLAASVVLLLLVFVPGLGADWGTSHSWINVFGFSLQPAEIVKLTFLIYLAALLEGKGNEGVRDLSAGLVPFLSALGIIAVLIMLQPDLGSLMVIAAIAVTVYFVAGAPWKYLLGMGGAGFLALMLLIKSAPYRAARLMTFLHPELDPQGVGYHINQAFLAIGSGGLFGQGLGHSRQKYLYLPEVAGDSIFAVMAEEFGFVLMLAVLALILAFVLRGLRIAQEAPDAFGRYVATGIVAWIFFQTLFNVGSMVGIMPITGLPMPFVSYGGTAMMVLLAAMGVLASIARAGSPSRARR
jgi:cell division protein FtsW